LGKVLVLVGLAIAALGALVMLGVPIGRLPGDIVFRRGHVTLYVPIVTSIVLSLLFTLLMLWLRR
jgi:hypothetical protein